MDSLELLAQLAGARKPVYVVIDNRNTEVVVDSTFVTSDAVEIHVTMPEGVEDD